MGRRIAIVAACVALFGVWASTAWAYPSGQFTKAEATPDWSKGSFAGSVTWDACNAGCKSYVVLIYAEPSVYTCQATDWQEESDPNIRQVWNSKGQTTNKTIPFEVNDVALIPGVFGQRLCMIGVQSTETEYGTFVGQQLVTQTLFKVAAPPPPPPPAPTATTTTPPPTRVAKGCKLARKRVNRLRKHRKRARQAGKRKRVRKLSKAIRRAVKTRRVKCQ